MTIEAKVAAAPPHTNGSKALATADGSPDAVLDVVLEAVVLLMVDEKDFL